MKPPKKKKVVQPRNKVKITESIPPQHLYSKKHKCYGEVVEWLKDNKARCRIQKEGKTIFEIINT